MLSHHAFRAHACSGNYYYLVVADSYVFAYLLDSKHRAATSSEASEIVDSEFE